MEKEKGGTECWDGNKVREMTGMQDAFRVRLMEEARRELSCLPEHL